MEVSLKRQDPGTYLISTTRSDQVYVFSPEQWLIWCVPDRVVTLRSGLHPPYLHPQLCKNNLRWWSGIQKFPTFFRVIITYATTDNKFGRKVVFISQSPNERPCRFMNDFFFHHFSPRSFVEIIYALFNFRDSIMVETVPSTDDCGQNQKSTKGLAKLRFGLIGRRHLGRIKLQLYTFTDKSWITTL